MWVMGEMLIYIGCQRRLTTEPATWNYKGRGFQAEGIKCYEQSPKEVVMLITTNNKNYHYNLFNIYYVRHCIKSFSYIMYVN